MIELLALSALLAAVASVEAGRSSARRSYVGAVLQRHTEQFLDRMQSEGWYPAGSRQRSHDRPTEWDINCGACDEWAEEARKLVGGEVWWVDQLLPVDPEEVCHCVLALGGKYYDSQHPDGVDRVEDLDLVKQTSKEEFVERRALLESLPPPIYDDGSLVAVHDYYGEPGVQALHHAFKAGDPAAIEQVCAELAPYVPPDAVLVAMPDHTGRSRNTLELVRCLSSVTGRPWSAALVGDPRESLYEAKKRGGPLPEVRLRVEGPVPRGRVVVVDHVLSTGTTARAALAAFPYGEASVLVHAVDLTAIGSGSGPRTVSSFDWTPRVLHQAKVGDSTIVYAVEDRVESAPYVKISSLRTPRSKRLEGSARGAMETFLAAVDRDISCEVRLDASPLDKRTSLGRLVQFYRSLGFEPTGRSVNVLGHPQMSRPPNVARGSFQRMLDGRLVGYRACSYDPETNELVSGADSRQRLPAVQGSLHRMTGQGMFLAAVERYAIDHYANHDLNAICRYAFSPSDVVTGSLDDREPEISVRSAELLDFHVIDADGYDWEGASP